MLPAIPEMASAYPTHASYQQYPNPSPYAAGQHATSLRPEVSAQWNTQPMMTHVESMDPYVSAVSLSVLSSQV